MIASWVRLGVTSMIAVIQAPILFRHLPAVELGVWYLLFAVANFISLSDLGLPTALSRAVSFRWGRDAPTGVSRGEEPSLPSAYLRASVAEIYGSALAATFALTLVAALVALPVALMYFQHTLAEEPLRDAILGPLVVFLAGIVLNLVAAIPSAYLQGTGDVAWDSVLRTLVQIAGLVAIWVLIPRMNGLGTLCSIYVGQGALLLVGAQILMRWRHHELRVFEVRARMDVIHTMYRESLPFFLSRVGLWLTLESTLLIGAFFLGSDRIADFAVLRQVVMMGASLTAAIAGAASPHVSAAYAAGDRDRVRGLYLGVVRYSLVVNILWSVGTVYWAGTVLDLLVGPGHFLGYATLVPLTIGTLLGYHAGAHGTLTWSIGKWPFAPVTLAAGALNIAFTALGCAYLGFPGLAAGPLIAEALTVDWIQVVLALRRVGIPVRDFVRGTALPSLSYALAFTVVAGLVRWASVTLAGSADAWGRLHPIATAGIGIGVTGAAGAALAWFLGLTAGDRAYILALAKRR